MHIFRLSAALVMLSANRPSTPQKKTCPLFRQTNMLMRLKLSGRSTSVEAVLAWITDVAACFAVSVHVGTALDHGCDAEIPLTISFLRGSDSDTYG